MRNSLLLSMILVTLVAVADNSDTPKLHAKEQAKLDQLRASVQVICPVSGQKLGAHGQPIKVAIGKKKEQVFLCCQACKTGKLDPAHWATIHKNIKSAQSICPVMEKPLHEKSNFTIVGGNLVYVCCPPCIEKIEAEPRKFIAKVNVAYEKHLAEETADPNRSTP